MSVPAHRRLSRSLSFRLALLYAGLFCLSVAVLAGASYWATVLQPLADVRRDVHEEAEAMAQVRQSGGVPALRAALIARSRDGSERVPFHALIDAEGKVELANLPSWPAVSSGGKRLIEADRFFDGFEIDYSALVDDRVFTDGSRLIVGRDVEDIVRREELLRQAVIYLLGGTLVLGLSGGWLMSRAIGVRIDLVSSTARRVMAGDLSERIPLRGSGDDFDRLSETLNLMLSRIQELFEAVRRVSDNVAHELRTPLARLTLKLEAAQDMTHDEAAMRIALDEAIVEANRLRDTFAALIRISRLEGGRHQITLGHADVVQLVEDVVDFYQPEAERRNIQLELSAERPILAQLDVDLVFQALSNLLDNAIKHALPHSAISIEARKQAAALVISIADNGNGLAAADIDRITERFYRGESSSGLPGEGLGLSVVSAICAAHGATITFADNHPGLKATLTFPLDRR